MMMVVLHLEVLHHLELDLILHLIRLEDRHSVLELQLDPPLEFAYIDDSLFSIDPGLCLAPQVLLKTPLTLHPKIQLPPSSHYLGS